MFGKLKHLLFIMKNCIFVDVYGSNTEKKLNV